MTTVLADQVDSGRGSGAASLARGQLPLASIVGIGVIALVVAAGATYAIAGSNLFVILVLGWLLFSAALYVLSAKVEGRRRAADRVATVVVSTAFGVATLPLISLVLQVVSRGTNRFDPTFFTDTMRNVLGVGGGGAHALVGTVMITGLAGVISVPVGILVAIYLVEYGTGALARSVTLLVDVMTGIPSIVAGLFAAGLFTQLGGPGTKNGFAGAVALSVLMVPIVVRSSEEMLRLVPNELREASYGLGVPKWRTIVKVVLPTAIAGILTGVTLSVARVIGETAPLLIAVGTTDGMNLNPFSGRMETLPIMAYYEYTQPLIGDGRQASYDRSWTASLTLMLIVMLLFGLARVIARTLKPKGLK